MEVKHLEEAHKLLQTRTHLKNLMKFIAKGDHKVKFHQANGYCNATHIVRQSQCLYGNLYTSLQAESIKCIEAEIRDVERRLVDLGVTLPDDA